MAAGPRTALKLVLIVCKISLPPTLLVRVLCALACVLVGLFVDQRLASFASLVEGGFLTAEVNYPFGAAERKEKVVH